MKIKKIYNTALSLSFLAAIWLPMAASFFGFSEGVPLEEKRDLAPLPALPTDLKAMADFPPKFESFLNDNFGMRRVLVRSLNKLRSTIPGVVVAGKVLVGEEGWLYYADENNIDDYRGLVRLSEEQLAEMRDNLEERRRWLAAFGCRYLLIISPTKWEIYPENIPGNINRVSESSQLDQITDYLRENSEIDFINLKKPLLEGKKHRLVYYKTDTHWNQYGAFIAVRETHKKLSQWYSAVSVESEDQYQIEKRTSVNGNLATMMALVDMEHTVYTLSRKQSQQTLIESSLDWIRVPNTLYSKANDNSNLPAAVFFHDSSGDKLRDFLPYSFSRCLFVWHDVPDPLIIESTLPDIVIEEIGQRTLAKRLAHNPEGISGSFSSISANSTEIHYPPGVKSINFSAKATKSSRAEQFIRLEVNGRQAESWGISPRKRNFNANINAFTSADVTTILRFSYGYLPRQATKFNDHVLPFHLKVETGGRNPNHCIVGINGLMMPREKGYNVYFLDASKPVFAEHRNFNTSWSMDESKKLNRFLRTTARRRGYMLLVSRFLAGRKLTHGAFKQMNRLGLEADLRNHPSWNHIALIDLSIGKPIVEKFGPGRQTLEIGTFSDKAGFFISDLRIEPKPSPPPD